MQFDDRLATVLRASAESDAAARTQFRQLLDLLGSAPASPASDTQLAAYARLDELADRLPGTVQSAIIREPGLRQRNPALLARLAQSEPQAAAAAMATARLNEREWLDLIPRLPLIARGFLRHRRDLPPGARRILQQLGVQDLVLPPLVAARPETVAPQAASAASPATDATPNDADRSNADQGIAELLRRIEQFRRRREQGSASPRLPLAGLQDADAANPARTFDFATDSAGVVRWASPVMASMAVGMTLLAPGSQFSALVEPSARRALARRQVLRGVRLALAGPQAIAGAWQIDAAPHFTANSGSFAGYRGRLRRPAPRLAPSTAAPLRSRSPDGDRMRQVLHELRTPVNAIQGFAEIIQQQLFGPVPNEYRALSAAIAVDAARLLGGFEELDRLAMLESGAIDLTDGISDFERVLSAQVRRLEGVLRPRSAQIHLQSAAAITLVALQGDDCAQLAWRLLASLAGALAPGESIALTLSQPGERLQLDLELPLSLCGTDDLFAGTAPQQARAISAGMFGSGFTLRLARAEAEAAGGGLEHREEALTLWLPVLRHKGANDYQINQANGGIAAA
ncbi:MAG: hypothetical protein RLZZ08_1593 [Pseudomonadota bacterium]|jgi:signal transduction histidine kinase